MTIKPFRKSSKILVLVACLALLGQSTGCSVGSLIGPAIKMGYNTFASIFNSTIFGTSTSTGF